MVLELGSECLAPLPLGCFPKEGDPKVHDRGRHENCWPSFFREPRQLLYHHVFMWLTHVNPTESIASCSHTVLPFIAQEKNRYGQESLPGQTGMDQACEAIHLCLNDQLSHAGMNSAFVNHYLSRKSEYGEGKMYWVCIKMKGSRKWLGFLNLSSKIFWNDNSRKTMCILHTWQMRRTKRDIFREFVEEDESATGNRDVRKVDRDSFDLLGEGLPLITCTSLYFQ